jgi:serine/threonine protein kinase
MAPEAMDVKQAKLGYNGKIADIWSLGITFYCLVYMQPPFTGAVMDLIKKVTTE